ncbi:MAG TPA: hypothetical protein VMP01_24705, partial [Pirellulaceae bacterium]|nr:hypothetical protein [Pirellulaceae bacterium]
IRVAPAIALGIAGLTVLIVSLAVTNYGYAAWRPWRASLVWQGWVNTAQGTSAALAILSGAWIIWGTGRLTTRLAVSAAWMTLVLLLWQVMFRLPRVPWLRYEQFLAASIWLAAIGLVAAAWRFGIRVVDPAGQVLATDPRSRQMSLLGLLSLMTGVAVMLAGVRLILPREFSTWSITGDDIFGLLAQVSGTLLVASTVITCFHVPRPVWLNLALASGFILMIAVLHLIAYGQSYRLNLLPPDTHLQVKVVYYAVLAAWLLAAVGIMHLCGLRLRRCAPWGRVMPLPAAS